MSKYVLISKDALCTDYLPVYGNKRWNTPNLIELAQQGTVFNRHYTAAPSTVMSFFSAITGKYAHETKYETYEKIGDVYQGETLFTKLHDKGYQCHIIWGDIWSALPQYFDCYRDDVKMHVLDTFKQGVGAHYIHEGFLRPDDEKKEETLLMVKNEVEQVLNTQDDVFLWIHFPHVINGEVAYGSDIELFDRYIGMIRQYVSDDCIAVTSDHGNMNGHKGKLGYAYDVYECEIRIPLITPRKEGIGQYNELTSTVDLYELLFGNKIPKRTIVYSDSAYRAQNHRKLAIVSERYKYIYNKETDSEELYDLDYDPSEEFSLMEDYAFDPDRNVKAPSRELYYYPDWDLLPSIRSKLRQEKNKIWKNG